MDLIPYAAHLMDLTEVDAFEKQLQTAFPLDDLHVIIDVDGRAEVWSGETALMVKWASVDPEQLIGLPSSLTPRKLTDVLYDMVFQEVERVLKVQKETTDGD
jgi:hypothetical protein